MSPDKSGSEVVFPPLDVRDFLLLEVRRLGFRELFKTSSTVLIWNWEWRDI
ncbi:MAG: hypothetical protein AAFQ91_08575 [Cyanobacteria bacterium J06621_15]